MIPGQVEIRDKDGRLVRKVADHAAMSTVEVDYSQVKWDAPDRRDMRDPEDVAVKLQACAENLRQEAADLSVPLSTVANRFRI